MKKLILLLLITTTAYASTFTAFAPQKLGTSTLDIAQAQFFGSVTWQETTNCQWSRTSSSFGAYAADVDCDDNARTIRGSYNTTNGDAGNSDGQLPQIKFSSMPAGTYVIEARSLHLVSATAGSACSWRFSDGTNTTTGHELNFSVTNSIGIPTVMGYLHYDTDQTAKTISLHAAASSGTPTCYTFSDAYRPFEITVRHYPSAQNSFRTTCSGLECENSFSADVTSADVVSNENVDWINGNCTDATTGFATCTFQSGLFSVAPNCQVTGDQGNDLATIDGAASTTSVRVRTQAASTVTDTDLGFTLFCQRAGSDYNQMDKRFVPVVDPEARYAAITAANVTVTADTLLQLVVEKDDYGLVDTTNDKFDIDKTGEYELCAGGNVAAGTSNWAAFYYRINSGGNEYFNGMAPSASSGVTLYPCKTISLNAGDDLYLRTQSGSTSAISIIRATLRYLPDRKNAYIAGSVSALTESVNTPNAVSPVIYSAYVSAAGVVSNEYSNWINGSVAVTDTSLFTITLESGAFSANPNCEITPNVTPSTASFHAAITSSSSSSIVVRTYYSTTGLSFAKQADAFFIVCHGVQ